MISTLAKAVASSPTPRVRRSALQQLAGRLDLAPWNSHTEPVDPIIARWRWIVDNLSPWTVAFIGYVFDPESYVKLGFRTKQANHAYGKFMSWVAHRVHQEGLPEWRDVEDLAYHRAVIEHHYTQEYDRRLVREEDRTVEEVYDTALAAVSNPNRDESPYWGDTNWSRSLQRTPMWLQNGIRKIERGTMEWPRIRTSMMPRSGPTEHEGYREDERDPSQKPTFLVRTEIGLSDGSIVGIVAETWASAMDDRQYTIERSFTSIGWHGPDRPSVFDSLCGDFELLADHMYDHVSYSLLKGMFELGIHGTLLHVIKTLEMALERAVRFSELGKLYDKNDVKDISDMLQATRAIFSVMAEATRVTHTIRGEVDVDLPDWIVENPQRFSELTSGSQNRDSDTSSIRHFIEGYVESSRDALLAYQQHMRDLHLARQRLQDEASYRAHAEVSELGTVTRAEFSDGAKILELLTPRALIFEGEIMHHCIGREEHGWPGLVRSGETRAFSYRDPEGRPQATWAASPGGSLRTMDVQGPWDRSIGDQLGAGRMLVFIHRIRAANEYETRREDGWNLEYGEMSKTGFQFGDTESLLARALSEYSVGVTREKLGGATPWRVPSQGFVRSMGRQKRDFPERA
tara:strand:+ start:114 stop:2000 length:1887 start_codon:yes stop_codon:yes gene_type:complete